MLIADVCAGSGALGVALLKHLPGARAVASDISAEAIDVARENAKRHNVLDRIDFLRGDLLAPLRAFAPTAGDGCLDYLVSNPPYIPDDEWPDKVDRNVREHEPEIALRGGPDGLRFVRPIIEQGAALLKPGGQVLVEVADSRAEQALEILRGVYTLGAARILQDHEGLRRVVVGERA
jgi:release factor glutamine methyltransferase